MDAFELTILRETIKAVVVDNRLEFISKLTQLGDYIKRKKVKDPEILDIYSRGIEKLSL